MNIAICLRGKIGQISGKYGTVNNVDFELTEKAYKYFKKNIIDINNSNKNSVDIFFHCWDKEYEEKLVELYKPKRYEFQEQIDFKLKGKYNTPRKNVMQSQWYSTMKSINLMREYENENKFKYDVVISTRFDTAFLKPYIFDKNKLNLNKCLYHSGPQPCHKYPQIYPIIHNIHKGECCNPNSIKFEIGDFFFFSNSDNMFNWSRLYNNLEYYFYNLNIDSCHVLAFQQAKKLNLKTSDFELYTKTFNIWRGFRDGDITLIKWMPEYHKYIPK